MCGIAGIVYRDKNRVVDQRALKRMCDVIVHRGPDDEGFYQSGSTGLGMRRLSIIDLNTGHQPIHNEDKTAWIVFNGEIYNFKEIRQELERKGHQFYTLTDTECILHAYEEYGPNCVHKLNGMFAFAIWDGRQELLFLARDRVGIKPLYYYLDGEKFIWGSELKSILQVEGVQKTLDLEALDHFLTFEYIPAPESIFKEIRKLPPGHFLILRDGQLTVQRYWQIPPQGSNSKSEEDHSQSLRELLQDSVRLRLISDVPLGAFLSGGIDSSTIVALMAQVMNQPVKTFSIGFEEASYNELEYARLIARTFQTEHHEFIIKPDAIELVEKLIFHLDEPFGDFSIFPTYLVSRMARDYVTVVLSGDGGDELFGGYDTYLADKYARFYHRIPRWIRRYALEPVVHALPPTPKKKGLINILKRFVEGCQHPEDLAHVRWMIFLSERDKERLYTADVQFALGSGNGYAFMEDYFRQASQRDPINADIFVDLNTYLVDDILVKVDRMSMATSLEARVPFLDHRVVEYSFSIPGDLKVKGAKRKYILKKSMEGLLPREILTRGKEGFSIPIKNWLRRELKDLMLDVLSAEKIKRQGLFDVQYVQRLVDEHLRGVENHSHRLWALMMFELWFDLFGQGVSINT